jgi:hypothetical protein
VPRLEASDVVERLTDWELFQSHASLNIQDVDKATRDFAASVASAYRISTIKTTILYGKYEIPGLNILLKYKRKLRILSQKKQGSSVQSGGKLSHSIYQENGPEKSTRKMGNKVDKLRSHTSGSMGWIKNTIRKS